MSIYLNGTKIDADSRYPDGTYSIRLDCDPACASIIWQYHGEHELPVVIYLAKHLRETGCKLLSLFLPYIPNARLDRTKSDCEVFTLKYFAWIINSLNFDFVRVLDPHSSVACALIDRVIVTTPDHYVKTVFNDIVKEAGTPPLMFYPDEGAMKRYSGMVPAPYAFGIKKRDWRSGEITALEIHGDDLNNQNVLMVDDICSRGGTFYHSARALKEAGANDLYIYVTHCENTIFQGELLKNDLIKRVYTTDSIFTGSHEKITVLSV